VDPVDRRILETELREKIEGMGALLGAVGGASLPPLLYLC
jgi:hypothetical protein